MSSMRSLLALSLMHPYVTKKIEKPELLRGILQIGIKQVLAKLETLISRHATKIFHPRIEREIKTLYFDCKGKAVYLMNASSAFEWVGVNAAE